MIAFFPKTVFTADARAFETEQCWHGRVEAVGGDYKKISGSEDRPLIYADWYMSWCFALFCHWNGYSCKLPREHQWEYAAKAETAVLNWPDAYRDFWWSDNLEDGRAHCTFGLTETTPPPEFTQLAAGATHHENPFGLVDMLGNVWEWTASRYHRRFSYRTDESESRQRVLRGGSWLDLETTTPRCAGRYFNIPTYSGNYVGCRLIRVRGTASSEARNSST